MRFLAYSPFVARIAHNTPYVGILAVLVEEIAFAIAEFCIPLPDSNLNFRSYSDVIRGNMKLDHGSELW